MMIRRKTVRLIKQKLPSDCAICCFAMLTGIRHRDVMRLVGDCWSLKKGMMDTRESLVRLGLEMKKIKIGKHGHMLEEIDFKLMHKRYEISPEYFRDQIWGRRALLSVPSLNVKNGHHMVYWHYNRLYDPSTKKTYKDYDELKPSEIVIFMES